MAVTTATPISGNPAPEPPARRRWLPARACLLRLLAAAGGGIVLYLSFPPRPLWWLAPVSLALLAVAVRGRRIRSGFGFGFLYGAGFLVPLLHWTGLFVGPLPWFVLCFIEALFFGLVAAAIALVSTMRGWPLWAALLWVGGEALRARALFGGFPWGKLAFGQPDGVYVSLAGLGGTPLVGFAVALSGFGLGALAVHLATGPRTTPSLAGPALAVVLPVAASALAWLAVGTDANAGTATAAAVQGNVPRLGLDFNSQRRAVLDNHVTETAHLADLVHAGTLPQPDLVIWPENSSDIDPFVNSDAREEIDAVAKQINAPISVGAVLAPPTPDGDPKNTAILWDPEKGPQDIYVKRKLQPFGETMPMRSFLSHFSKYVDKANHFAPGTDPKVFTMGPAKVGTDTCYEVAFDDVVRASVTDGATLISVPTNNATFGLSEMTYQQLAMDQVRAVEHGRSVVVAATSGVSAIIEPDGTIAQHTGVFTPGVLVAKVPLRSTTTVADSIGTVPEWVMALAGLLALGRAAFTRLRTRRAGTPATAPATGD